MAKRTFRKAPRLDDTGVVFFATAADFRQWLAENAAVSTALIVGYHKVGSGKRSMSWSESVDEALCYGWIDGVRKRIDDQSYQIRFTARRSGSIWSAVNIGKIESLRSQGRMTQAGLIAFASRTDRKSRVYSYERAREAKLSTTEVGEFKKAGQAWKFFNGTPAGYQKVCLHWIAQAKKPETRIARFRKLLQVSAAGKRVRCLSTPGP